MTVRRVTTLIAFTWFAFAPMLGCYSRAGPAGPSQQPPSQRSPVDVRGRASPVPDAQLQRCDQHCDCDNGMFCRDRGDKVKLCMGKGGPGAYCTDTVDCREPLFCRPQRRKLRLCM